MEISITVESFGMNWDRWKELITRLESDGYATIFKCDHFIAGDQPPDDHLETYVALTYLASHVSRVNFGPLVSPVSFRDPVMLARQAMAIDDLSGGRMILGVGAGWMQEEHDMFGYALGTIKERLDRLEEGLEVMTKLIRSDDPVTFDGQYYQLQDAILLPRPQRKTPILIGAGGRKRTMPMVAKYADIWNSDTGLDNFKDLNVLLNDLLKAEGRPLTNVKRTNTVFMGCWQTDAERDQVISEVSDSLIGFVGGVENLIGFFKDRLPATSPKDVVDHLKAFEDAGCEELVIHYFGMNGDTQLDIFAEHILPHFN